MKKDSLCEIIAECSKKKVYVRPNFIVTNVSLHTWLCAASMGNGGDMTDEEEEPRSTTTIDGIDMTPTEGLWGD